jgi:hypothetical protein
VHPHAAGSWWHTGRCCPAGWRWSSSRACKAAHCRTRAVSTAAGGGCGWCRRAAAPAAGSVCCWRVLRPAIAGLLATCPWPCSGAGSWRAGCGGVGAAQHCQAAQQRIQLHIPRQTQRLQHERARARCWRCLAAVAVAVAVPVAVAVLRTLRASGDRIRVGGRDAAADRAAGAAAGACDPCGAWRWRAAVLHHMPDAAGRRPPAVGATAAGAGAMRACMLHQLLRHHLRLLCACVRCAMLWRLLRTRGGCPRGCCC